MASPSCSSAASRLSSLQRHLHPSHSCSDYKGAGFIKVSPEVSEALLNGQAVVALQSIIISHGSSTEELARLVILVPKLKRQLGGTLYMFVCYWRDWESSSIDMVMKKEEPTTADYPKM